MDIKAYFKEKGALVTRLLDAYFNGADFLLMPAPLRESMRYSLLAGGKRLRPILAIAACETVGGRAEDIIQAAAALEVVHTYSLIHDDLPAMDDDDLRRGIPTNHKVYGEAMAILAGDGLLTEAFTMVLGTKGIPSERLAQAAWELSQAAGPRGMVGGQAQDMISENSEPDTGTLSYIHTHKTGALITASVRIGAILGGADARSLATLTHYGDKLGLAFQIVDDILDIVGDEAVIGKPVGSDLDKKKMTYPALYGLDASRAKAAQLIDGAIADLEIFNESAGPLRAIALMMKDRDR